MKATLNILSIFFLSLVSIQLKAGDDPQDPKIEKKKTIAKTYALSGNDRVSFDNRFGDIHINTWDKGEVKVDIVLSGMANSDEVAQELLDRLSVEDGKSGNQVYFKTKISEKNERWPKGTKFNNTRFSVNYTVYLPSSTALNIENEFGKTFVPDYKGEITINQKFGQLTAGRLNMVKKIHIEFSGGSLIESVNGGELDIKFSRTQVNRMEGTVKANFEHSGSIKIAIDNSLKELTVKNAFTQVYLDVPSNLSASFNIHTNFSEFNNKTAFSVKEEEEDQERRGPKFDHDYSGKSGSGSTPIKINSEFGQVIMGHNISFDVNEKEEKKTKTTIRTV